MVPGLAVLVTLLNAERPLLRLLAEESAGNRKVRRPAFFGAHADVHVHADQRQVFADRILAAFQHVPRLGLLDFTGDGILHLVLEHTLVEEIHDVVLGAGVVHEIAGLQRGIHRARPRTVQHLASNVILRRAHDVLQRLVGVLVANRRVDVLPLRLIGIRRRVGRIEGHVALHAGAAHHIAQILLQLVFTIGRAGRIKHDFAGFIQQGVREIFTITQHAAGFVIRAAVVPVGAGVAFAAIGIIDHAPLGEA